jgi:Flp pilus assembly protein TadG
MFGIAKARRQRRGANAIEFALTLPFYLMIVLGLVDYGFLFGMQAGIDNATSMACRAGAMQDPDRGSPTARAVTAFGGMGAMFCAGGACGPGLVVDDRATGDYEFPNRTLQCTTTRTMTPLVGFVPYPATINSVSFYRLEWQRQP